jgi:hypothetical protein
MDRWHSSVLRVVRIVVWVCLPCLLGFLVAFFVGKIPSTGGLPFIPVNPLVPPVLFVSGIMFLKLMSSFRNSSTLFIVMIILILIGTTTMYLTSIDAPKEVVFNTRIVNYLTLLTYFIAVLPFLWRQKVISFQQERAERHSVFFASTIMWLAPFFADILVMAKWYVSGVLESRLAYMVLGGNGANDVLFFYGFWLLISMELFHLFGRKMGFSSRHNGACASKV